jgi:hypothetical protein
MPENENQQRISTGAKNTKNSDELTLEELNTAAGGYAIVVDAGKPITDPGNPRYKGLESGSPLKDFPLKDFKL